LDVSLKGIRLVVGLRLVSLALAGGRSCPGVSRNKQNVIRKPMAGKSEKRKGGRPATGQDPVTALRLSPKKRKEIEAWAAQQADKPSFSEAVRRLLDHALETKSAAAKPRRPAPGRASGRRSRDHRMDKMKE
jgi:hypothetical protein